MARKITRGEQPKQGKRVANKTGGKKAAAERLIKDLQKNAKDSGEDLPGLDKLIESIQKEVNESEKKEKKKKKESKKKISALVQEVTDNEKKKEDKKEKEVLDERVFDILGLEDNGDLDYEEVTSLIKEYLVKNREEDKEGDTESLKTTLKNVKGKKGKFQAKKKKSVSASGFKGDKVGTSKQRFEVVDKDKFIPQDDNKKQDQLKGESISQEQIEEIKAEVQENTQKQLLPLSESLSSIEQNLQKLLDVNQKKLQVEQQQIRDQSKKDETEGFKKGEAKLEDEKKGKSFKKKMKGVLKPVAGVFDTIGNFFKNVLLGMAVVELLDFIQNPGKFFKGITDFLNATLIPFINDVIKFFNDVIFAPINFVIDGFNAGINELEYALKQIQKIIPIPDITFPDIPNLKIPDVPPIPDGFGLFQQQAGGGEVINVNNLSLFDGGAIDGRTGLKIAGMGKDTQLIAAQPGEVMMSKKAVDMFGAGNLLAANAMAGGDNKPKFGKIAGFQGGGLVSGAPYDVIIPLDHTRNAGTIPDTPGGNTFTASNQTGAMGMEREGQDPAVAIIKKRLEELGVRTQVYTPEMAGDYQTYDNYIRGMAAKGVNILPIHFDAGIDYNPSSPTYGQQVGTGFMTITGKNDQADAALADPIADVLRAFQSNNPDLGNFKQNTQGNLTVNLSGNAPATLIELGVMEYWRKRYGDDFTNTPEFTNFARDIAGAIAKGVGADPSRQKASLGNNPVGSDFTMDGMGMDAIDGFDSTGSSQSSSVPLGRTDPFAPPQSANVGRSNVTVQVTPYGTQTGGGGPAVAVDPSGQQQPNSAAAVANKSVPAFSAEDSGNFDLIVVKSIYNIVG